MGLWRWFWVSVLVVSLAEEFMDDEEEGEDLEETISKDKLRALHAKFDKNGDGKVSLAEVLEFADHQAQAIAGRDVKAILEDGRGLGDDLPSSKPPWRETSNAVLNVVVKDTMKARDKDGDGVLSFKEFSEQEPADEEGITAP
eukprot:s230_g14.t1